MKRQETSNAWLMQRYLFNDCANFIHNKGCLIEQAKDVILVRGQNSQRVEK